MGFVGRLRQVVMLLIVGSIALLIAACRSTTPPAPNVAAAASTETEFVGNTACVECHQKEFEAHKGTRHDITLRPATRESLGEIAPPTGTVPLAGYTME